jgi:hypothetical protein
MVSFGDAVRKPEDRRSLHNKSLHLAEACRASLDLEHLFDADPPPTEKQRHEDQKGPKDE